jgi:hypothetical protein
MIGGTVRRRPCCCRTNTDSAPVLQVAAIPNTYSTSHLNGTHDESRLLFPLWFARRPVE